MNVKILKTMSGPEGVKRAGSEHEVDDEEALRLIDAGIAESTDPNFTPPEPQNPPAGETDDDDEDGVVTLTPPIGTPEFFEAWDEATEEELVAQIATWNVASDDPAVLTVAPTQELIWEISEHEEEHEDRPAVLAALEEACEREPASIDPPPPTDPPAPTVEELIDENDRRALNKLAADAGVGEPEKLKSKTAVAEAIVAARG